MTERFNLAANVLLFRRLKNLLRIDDNVEIDMSYITCAEYQLFIDEKRESDEERQPDHWKSYIFPSKDARKPIAGVRASDAEAFCEWLTHRYSLPGFRYRLPILSEAEEHRATEKQIGCWCNDGVKKVIVGIEMSQAQAWMEDLADVLACDLKGIEALVQAFVLEDFKNLKDFNILTLTRTLDSHSDIHITDALHQAGIYFLPAKMTEQVNIIKNDYFQSFNLLSVLSEFNFCCFNFINHMNSDCNKIIGVMKVIASTEKLVCSYRNDIADSEKRILELTEARSNYEKQRDIFDDVIRLTTNRSYLLFIIFLLNSFAAQSKKDDVWNSYRCLVLRDARRVGQIPAWEGVRIVRERLQE